MGRSANAVEKLWPRAVARLREDLNVTAEQGSPPRAQEDVSRARGGRWRSAKLLASVPFSPMGPWGPGHPGGEADGADILPLLRPA
jgi:hypothetical protein